MVGIDRDKPRIQLIELTPMSAGPLCERLGPAQLIKGLDEPQERVSFQILIGSIARS